jgi:hypothetical protein
MPSPSTNADAKAKSEFGEWISGELNRMPDELEVLDHRELRWPPQRESEPFWIIKYRSSDPTGLEDDKVGCGVVGSVTTCLFSKRIEQRPPEDIYAIHCFWEMDQDGLLEEAGVAAASEEYAALLDEWNGPPLENPWILSVAGFAPELNEPQRIVALASATLNGQKGWAVLDGPRSEWYPADEQPLDAYDRLILRIHIGRQLLGFTDKPDRKKFLQPEPRPRPPEQIIRAFEKLLDEARHGNLERQKELLNGVFGPISKHLESYSKALRQTGRAEKIRGVIEFLTPHLDDFSGVLGEAAFAAGQHDLAEPFLAKAHAKAAYPFGELEDCLARIWFQAGRHDAAKELLLGCMEKIRDEDPGNIRLDVLEKWFQERRSTLIELFPNEAAHALRERGLPDSLAPA